MGYSFSTPQSLRHMRMFQIGIRVLTSVSIAHRKKAVPTAVSTGLDIGLSNLSLKTITLSFYSERFIIRH